MLVVTLAEEDTSRGVVVTVHPGTRPEPTAAESQLMLAFGDADDAEAAVAGLSTAQRTRLEADVRPVRQQGDDVVRTGGT